MTAQELTIQRNANSKYSTKPTPCTYFIHFTFLLYTYTKQHILTSFRRKCLYLMSKAFDLTRYNFTQ